MTKNIKLVSLAFVMLLISSMPAQSEQTEQQQLLERTNTINQLISQAIDINGLWRETMKLAETARKHADEGNFSLANEALSEAEYQAKLGIQQAQKQSEIKTLVPSYLQH